MNTLKGKLYDLRKSKRLSQEKLAGKVGLSAKTISRIETGDEVDLRTLKKLADFFGLTVTDLLDEDEVQSSGDSRNIYPALDIWLAYEAPADLTAAELESLRGLRFGSEPAPWQYTGVLAYLRCPGSAILSPRTDDYPRSLKDTGTFKK